MGSHLSDAERCWELLRRVRGGATRTRFARGGRTGEYASDVVVEEGDGKIRWDECGRWGDGRRESLRGSWLWERGGVPFELRLLHERYGHARPVLLGVFDLRDRRWDVRAGHVCADDVYTPRICFARGHVVLCWRVRGPEKRGVIRSVYRVDRDVID